MACRRRSSSSLSKAAQNEGTVVATPLTNDVSYLCPVTIGLQTFYLEFDSGSSDLWVQSSLSPANLSVGHSVYNPRRSPTAKLLPGYTWNITYGDRSGARGVVFTDTVDVGGVVATGQAVEAATAVSAEFTGQHGSDGLLGLAFSAINTVRPVKQRTFFDNVKPGLRNKLWTVDLKHQATGTFDFGVIKPSKYKGDITYTPVDPSTGFWTFFPSGFKVGRQPKVTGNQGASIADTGSSLLYVQQQAAFAYYAQVPGSTLYRGSIFIYPCNQVLPNFSVYIEGRQFTIPGRYLKYAVMHGNKCVGGIQGSAGLPFNIYGDIFLKAVFAVFDESQGQPRLGFAKKDLV
ncbi:hypothetical protein UVI_02059230 [Ustilaginoidea virens]|uniref:Peptidase A1 domain-containing protein n=1 Tax=Ustilaginoidea virens TaxID=1159556 RepID=A0A1B5L807_USTVR|nr:hypothetical protein UVI_02059230 [Ustilaginoidea virens]